MLLVEKNNIFKEEICGLFMERQDRHIPAHYLQEARWMDEQDLLVDSSCISENRRNIYLELRKVARDFAIFAVPTSILGYSSCYAINHNCNVVGVTLGMVGMLYGAGSLLFAFGSAIQASESIGFLRKENLERKARIQRILSRNPDLARSQ